MSAQTKLPFPKRNPRVRVLCYPDYLQEIKSGLMEILDKNEILRLLKQATKQITVKP